MPEAKELACQIAEACDNWGLSKAMFFVEVDGREYSVEVQLSNTGDNVVKPTQGFAAVKGGRL